MLECQNTHFSWLVFVCGLFSCDRARGAGARVRLGAEEFLLDHECTVSTLSITQCGAKAHLSDFRNVNYQLRTKVVLASALSGYMSESAKIMSSSQTLLTRAGLQVHFPEC